MGQRTAPDDAFSLCIDVQIDERLIVFNLHDIYLSLWPVLFDAHFKYQTLGVG
jgi:hypothetical protein